MKNGNIKLELLRNKKWVYLGGIVCLLLFSSYFIVLGLIYNQNFSSDSSTWGTFGDFFGGVAGTVLAFITIFLLYKSIAIQLIEFSRLSRLQQQQTFDTKFFNLMGMHNDILKNIQGRIEVDSKKQFFSGRDYIEQYTEDLKRRSISGEDIYQLLSKKKNLFRNLFVYLKNGIDYINDFSNNQEHYMELFRTQISNNELLIIAYFVSNKEWNDLRQYFELFNKNSLFKYLDVEKHLKNSTTTVPTAIPELIHKEILVQSVI